MNNCIYGYNIELLSLHSDSHFCLTIMRDHVFSTRILNIYYVVPLQVCKSIDLAILLDFEEKVNLGKKIFVYALSYLKLLVCEIIQHYSVILWTLVELLLVANKLVKYSQT